MLAHTRELKSTPREPGRVLASSSHPTQFHSSPQSTHKPQKAKTRHGPDAGLATGELQTPDHRPAPQEQRCPANPQAPTSVPVGPRAAGMLEPPDSEGEADALPISPPDRAKGGF